MSSVLVFIQHQQGKILKASLVAFSAARELEKVWNKQGVVGVCLGQGAKVAAEESLAYGFSQVFYSEHASLEKFVAGIYVGFVRESYRHSGSDVVVAAATSVGKDLLARLAGELNAAQASDILAVNADGSLKRPMFAGNVIADVELMTAQRCISVRTTAFAPANPSQKSGSVSEIPMQNPEVPMGEVVSYELSGGGRPELSDAEVIVSGGRALQSSENFEKYIFPLADAFGAAVGASRAAVDSGYAPNDWQVGQTGKVVAPTLYVAVGISGAIQHLAGMKDSKVIVAINKDPDAPIFEVADFGLVADLYQAVPEFTEAVKKAKSS